MRGSGRKRSPIDGAYIDRASALTFELGACEAGAMPGSDPYSVCGWYFEQHSAYKYVITCTYMLWLAYASPFSMLAVLNSVELRNFRSQGEVGARSHPVR